MRETGHKPGKELSIPGLGGAALGWEGPYRPSIRTGCSKPHPEHLQGPAPEEQGETGGAGRFPAVKPAAGEAVSHSVSWESTPGEAALKSIQLLGVYPQINNGA